MLPIAALKAGKEAISARAVKLEEELTLARLHRFAPESEKHVDRLFNVGEQVAVDVATDKDGDLRPATKREINALTVSASNIASPSATLSRHGSTT